jgi:hypothetical protein
VVYGVVLITLIGQGVGLRVLLPRWPGLHDGHDGQDNQARRPAEHGSGAISKPSTQAP